MYFLEKFIQEMCRCRTSMEHYHVKNYLHRHGELSDWKHKEDTCKWCAYPSSKKVILKKSSNLGLSCD